MNSVLNLEHDKIISRLEGYMKKRRFCNYCKRKIVSIYYKLQDRSGTEDSKEKDDKRDDSVGCDQCHKDRCYCKKCGYLINGSIGEFANTFAQHQNRKMNRDCKKMT